jgi:RNA polymerase sigma-70 factor (ECF subfamily)
VRVDGVLDGIMALHVEGDRVAGMYYVLNPEKLTRAGGETPLASR